MASGSAFILGLAVGFFAGMFTITLVAFISVKIKEKKRTTMQKNNKKA